MRLSDYVDTPNPALRGYLRRVVEGDMRVVETPFSRHSGGLKSVLKIWLDTLSQLEATWPTLLEFELHQAQKSGPMSCMKPLKDRISDVEDYYSKAMGTRPVSEAAIDAVLQEFAEIRGLRLRSTQNTVDLMKKSTNSGTPFFTRKRLVTPKTVPCLISGNDQVLNDGKYMYKLAAILGWRGQEGGPAPRDTKQRVVWMFPYALSIWELKLYQPLIEACQRFDLVPTWVSLDAVDKRITSLFDTKSERDDIISTDFSKFDQHFGPALQNCAYHILSQLYVDDADTRYWFSEIFGKKYNIPLIVNEHTVYRGNHGMASGSGGTNADETLVHRALQYEASLQRNKPLNPNSMCLGDDGILTYPGINVEDVMDTYMSHGLDMNKDKQHVSAHDCIYLQRWHHQNYRVNGVCAGVYSTVRALTRLCMQERYYDPDVWSFKMVALRQLSILENVKHHPLKEVFVNFCMERDRYRLGLEIPGFLDQIETLAREAIDYMPDFLGYTRSMNADNDLDPTKGIGNWWIVQYLKSQR